LSSTPRQIALYEAFAQIGVGNGSTPEFGHLPYVMGEGNRKLSKRDPESNLLGYRENGFLPEALLNYLALLGWAIADDRDVFTLDEMVEAFDISRVNPNPARFDAKKCNAINGDHIRMLAPGDLADRLIPYYAAAGIDISAADLAPVVPLIQERIAVLTEAPEMTRFLFVEDVTIPDEVALDDAGRNVVNSALAALEGAGEWTTESIEAALRAALIDELGLKPRLAFGPVRVAVTGSRISPPLFESLEILGRDKTLQRLRDAA
ncbi:MAG TPA: glutamate--tRNA ligase family protein, partial [Aeromicrobium sp.]|nr:glutamate--tRNA ligase family protein [Aeromicrobium sp.]